MYQNKTHGKSPDSPYSMNKSRISEPSYVELRHNKERKKLKSMGSVCMEKLLLLKKL